MFVSVFLSVCAPVFADDDVVLQASDFVVTTQDFDRYLTEQDIRGAGRDRAMAKKGAVHAVFDLGFPVPQTVFELVHTSIS